MFFVLILRYCVRNTRQYFPRVKSDILRYDTPRYDTALNPEFWNAIVTNRMRSLHISISYTLNLTRFNYELKVYSSVPIVNGKD